MMQIGYNVGDMEINKPAVARYMEKIYLAWINQIGQVRPQREFAEYLGMDRMRFNNYYNGKRTELDYQTALSICQKTGDYELMDILGYPRPEDPDPLSTLPPEIASSVRAALAEINSIYAERGISASSPEAREIAEQTLDKYLSEIRKESS